MATDQPEHEPERDDVDSELWETIERLDKDLRRASRLIGRGQARFFTDFYYQMQDTRIRVAGQIRASEGEPDTVLQWFLKSSKSLEDDIKRALGEFADQYAVGRWLLSITGIGPVISAGLLAHIDIRHCSTAGKLWRFAGLDPTVVWEKKAKRPWNARLKVLTWKAGESFIKFQNNKNDFYGKIYVEAKRRYVERNLRGDYIADATEIIERKNFKRSTDAFAWYSGRVTADAARKFIEDGERLALVDVGQGQPMLPPAHIHARARRYAVKMFLSHIQHVMWVDYHGEEPVAPYAFNLAGHGNREESFIPPPNFPNELGGDSLKDLLDKTAGGEHRDMSP